MGVEKCKMNNWLLSTLKLNNFARLQQEENFDKCVNYKKFK